MSVWFSVMEQGEHLNYNLIKVCCAEEEKCGAWWFFSAGLNRLWAGESNGGGSCSVIRLGDWWKLTRVKWSGARVEVNWLGYSLNAEHMTGKMAHSSRHIYFGRRSCIVCLSFRLGKRHAINECHRIDFTLMPMEWGAAYFGRRFQVCSAVVAYEKRGDGGGGNGGGGVSWISCPIRYLSLICK